MCFLQWEPDGTSDDEKGEVEQQFPSTQKLLTRGAPERRRAYWKIWKHVHVDTPWGGTQPRKLINYPKQVLRVE